MRVHGGLVRPSGGAASGRALECIVFNIEVPRVDNEKLLQMAPGGELAGVERVEVCYWGISLGGVLILSCPKVSKYRGNGSWQSFGMYRIDAQLTRWSIMRQLSGGLMGN